jgi:arylsulfatase A-like enzyme
MGKMGFYDQSYHIPLVIRDPFRLNSNSAGGVETSCVEAMFTESVDIFPTVMKWLGLNIPAQCDGASLLPLLGAELLVVPVTEVATGAAEGGAAAVAEEAARSGALQRSRWRTSAHWEVNYSAWGQPKVTDCGFQWLGQSIGVTSPEECYFCVVRTKEYKLVYFAGGLPSLLFHLAEDKDELHDVSGSSKHQTVLLRMMRELHDWRIRYGGAESRGLRRTKLNDSNTLITRL